MANKHCLTPNENKIMQIIIKKIADLKPYEKNARKHPQKQIDLLARNIERFGFTTPVLIDKDNEVIAGHGRLLAMKQLGKAEVPCVSMNDLSKAEIKALRLADNQIAAMGDTDLSLVISELKELDSLGFDIDLTGFDRDLLIEPSDEDNVIPENAPTRCKTGDIWQLGRHRILCSDSTDKKEVARLFDGKNCEMLFTSPPYADMRNYGGGDMSVEHLATFISAFEPFAKYQIVNLGLQRKNNELVEYWNEYIKIAKESGYKFLSWNVWNRETARSIGQQTAFFPTAHEWIFVFGKEFKDINKTREKAAYTRKDTRRVQSRRQKDGSTKFSSVGDLTGSMTEMTSVFTSQPELDNKVRSTHPATFPVLFPQEYIKAMTKIDDIVADPFLGSGTTLIAAEKTGRICYGMEIDEKYCDVIIKRYEDYTGGIAKKT